MSAGALEILTKARKLIEDPAHWIKGNSAMTAPFEHGGVRVSPSHPRAKCWCSIGAVQGAASRLNDVTICDRIKAEASLQWAVREKAATFGVVAFNDNVYTQHPDVLAVFDAAIEQLKGTV
jgi:hypothetical protein